MDSFQLRDVASSIALVSTGPSFAMNGEYGPVDVGRNMSSMVIFVALPHPIIKHANQMDATPTFFQVIFHYAEIA